MRDSHDMDMLYPDVWACKFAPRTPQEIEDGTGLRLVATCGLNSVCFTDCDQGKVVMKFPHYDEPNEQFHALAWTVLPHSDGGYLRVLAVAGRQKSIKLINTGQHICYRNITGHTGDIVDLQFCRQKPYWLLSGSEDATVRLWDIGGLSENDTATCLAVFDARYGVLKLAISPLDDFFLVTNQDCVVMTHDLAEIIERFDPDHPQHQTLFNGRKELEDPSSYPDGDGWHTSPVDLVAFLDYDMVLTKGSRDDILVWKDSESDENKPAVRRRCKYPEGDACFISGTVAPSRHVNLAVIGTGKGDLLVYDVTPKASKSKARKSQTPKDEPIFTLSHPKSKCGIRQVDISYDGKYIVAVDTDDCLWIWKAQ